MEPLRIAIIGTGFWSNFQIAAWQEIGGVEIVAAYNHTRKRAEEVAQKFGVPTVYDSAEQLMLHEQVDVVDIITDVDTHKEFTLLAAHKGIAVVCQKPMAPTLSDAIEMVDSCRKNNIPFFIHENFRWQSPIRALKEKLNQNIIGTPFKARVSFCSAFPVFDNQPFLADLENFILTDIGSHVLDICRYLFGEAKSLMCLTRTVNGKIKGEDVANVLMEMETGMHCFAEMSYASILEKEAFPQTLLLIEGEHGSIELANDFELKVTTRNGTVREMVSIPHYPWADPAYAVVHSSIVECNRNILHGLRGGKCETSGDDNIKTVKLVWACYESARTHNTIHL